MYLFTSKYAESLSGVSNMLVSQRPAVRCTLTLTNFYSSGVMVSLNRKIRSRLHCSAKQWSTTDNLGK